MTTNPPQAGSESLFPASVSRAEIAGWLVGMVIAYGASGMIGFAAAILAVGGDGSSGGVMLVGAFMLACVIGSFVLSLSLARKGQLALSVLAGFIPIGILFGLVMVLGLVL